MGLASISAITMSPSRRARLRAIINGKPRPKPTNVGEPTANDNEPFVLHRHDWAWLWP